MQFPKQKMTEKELTSSKLYKDIEKQLKTIPVVEINDNEHRVYRTPSTGKQALIYDLIFEFGKILFFVEKSGNVSRIVVISNQDGERVLETLGRGDKSLDMTPAKLAREVMRIAKKEQKAELRVKVSKPQMKKLLDSLDDDEIDNAEIEGSVEALTQLKKDLTKGSGKFLVVNDKNEVLGIDAMNGYVTNKLLYKVFNTIEDAKQAKQLNDKIVRI